MRRLLPALLLAALCLSLAACGAQAPAPTVTPEQTAGPAPTETPAPTPDPIASHPTSEAVFTDWSGLTLGASPVKELFTRLKPEPLETMQPGDYGLLLPFEGVRRYAAGMYSWEVDGLWGLVTREGEIVLDPVCSEIRRAQRYTELEGSVYSELYVLTKLVYEPDSPQATEYNRGWLQRCAVCAMDGSWCTDFVYEEVYASPLGALCVRSGVENLAECRAVDGRVLFDTADWAIRGEMNDWACYSLSGLEPGGWVPVYLKEQRYVYVNAKGQVLSLPEACRLEDAQYFSEGLAPVRVNGRWGFLDERGNMAIEPQYDGYSYGGFIDGRAIVYTDNSRRSQLIDRSGNVLLEAETIGREARYGNAYYHAFAENGYDRWYDGELDRVTYKGLNPDGCWIGTGFYFREPDGVRLLLFSGGERFFPDATDVSAEANGCCIVYTETECLVYNAAGEQVLATERGLWPYFLADSVTGTPYVYVYSAFGGYDVYTAEGEYLVHTDSWGGPIDSLFACSDNLTTGYKDPAGEWVFRVRVDQGD